MSSSSAYGFARNKRGMLIVSVWCYLCVNFDVCLFVLMGTVVVVRRVFKK